MGVNEFTDYRCYAFISLSVSRLTFYKYYTIVKENTDPVLKDVDFIKKCGKSNTISCGS